MKVAELKKTIRGYRTEQLRRLLVEMYKAMPKRVKEDHGIDDMICSPASKRNNRKSEVVPDIKALASETERFVSNAYNDHYYIPNRVVPKRERSQWRFTVLRLFKHINYAATRGANVAKAAELLEKLYVMLCYSCRYTLFSAYDSFQSVGVEQRDFFRLVLRHKRCHENPRDFVRNSIELALEHELNRYTLYDDLLEAIVAFLDTSDLKQIAIATCDEMWSRASIVSASARSASKSYEDHSTEYQRREFLQNLARLGFLCHMALCEYDEAVDYFHKHYVGEEPEIALYVLLNMIDGHQQWDLWTKTYQQALRCGIRPRPELKAKYLEIQERGAGISLTGRRSAKQKSATLVADQRRV
jgi:hypothetical protein